MAGTQGSPQQDRREVWRRYFESSARLVHRLEQSMRAASELTLADYNVLLLLTDAPDHRLRMGELARRLVFSPSRLTYLVKSLSERGLVERRCTAEDRRGMDAVLTQAGADAFRQAAVLHARDVHELFLDDLSDEDVAVLGRVFTELDTRLQAD
ncbi:MarR family winged helix-turn-helix transcriptional regulator [Micrococcus luteus]